MHCIRFPGRRVLRPTNDAPSSAETTGEHHVRHRDYRSRRSFLSGFGKITLSATAIALLAGQEHLALVGSAVGPDGQQRRHHPELRPGRRAAGDRRLPARRRIRACCRSRCSTSPSSSRAITSSMPTRSPRRCRSSAASRSTPLKDYSFPKDKLKSQNDVLAFAASLEKGAVSAYLGAVPSSPTATSPRPPPRSWATRRCTGPCCARRSARTRSPTPSCRDHEAPRHRSCSNAPRRLPGVGRRRRRRPWRGDLPALHGLPHAGAEQGRAAPLRPVRPQGGHASRTTSTRRR